MLQNNLSQNNAFMPQKLPINFLKHNKMNKNYGYPLVKKLLKRELTHTTAETVNESLINELSFYKKIAIFLVVCLGITAVVYGIAVYFFMTYTLMHQDQLAIQNIELQLLKTEIANLATNSFIPDTKSKTPRNYTADLLFCTCIVTLTLTIAHVGFVLMGNSLIPVTFSIMNDTSLRFALLAAKLLSGHGFALNLADSEGYKYVLTVVGSRILFEIVTQTGNVPVSEFLRAFEDGTSSNIEVDDQKTIKYTEAS